MYRTAQYVSAFVCVENREARRPRLLVETCRLWTSPVNVFFYSLPMTISLHFVAICFHAPHVWYPDLSRSHSARNISGHSGSGFPPWPSGWEAGATNHPVHMICIQYPPQGAERRSRPRPSSPPERYVCIVLLLTSLGLGSIPSSTVVVQ